MDWRNPFRRRAPEPEEQKNLLDFDSPTWLNALISGNVNDVSAEQALRLSAVYACVKVLSETIMTLPCELKKVEGDSRLLMANDRLHRLVSLKPNGFMTAAEMWAWVTKCICLQGNAYLYIVRNRSGDVVELLPLAPHAVSVDVYQPGNRIVYVINLGDTPMKVGPDSILHFRGSMIDDNGIQGMSPIKANTPLLRSAVNAREWSGNFFTNGAMPQGVLRTDESLSEDAYKNIKESWDAAHSGVNNAHRVAILEAGLEFQKISLTPDDIQLLETHKFTRAEIAGMYRVPPHMIAELENATYNNIEHQTLDFYKSTIAPWLRLYEQRLSFSLLGDTTRVFQFDVRELIRGDFAGEVEGLATLVDSQVITPNEARTRLGWNPREGGDEVVKPAEPMGQEPDDGDD